MDFRAHFESYRDSLKQDLFVECEEYAKRTVTADPKKYPTVYSYLSLTLSSVKKAIEEGNLEAYRGWLKHHQKAMLSLLERMADEILWGQDSVDVTQYGLLIKEKGWNWYKFCRKSVRLQMKIADVSTTVDVIPRYSEAFKDSWGKLGRIVFDANEMQLLSHQKTKELSQQILEMKKENPAIKLVKVIGDKDPVLRKIPDLNTSEVVYDWSLNLFGET
jgi:hypothetical protein